MLESRCVIPQKHWRMQLSELGGAGRAGSREAIALTDCPGKGVKRSEKIQSNLSGTLIPGRSFKNILAFGLSRDCIPQNNSQGHTGEWSLKGNTLETT